MVENVILKRNILIVEIVIKTLGAIREKLFHLEMVHLLTKLGISLYWLCSFFFLNICLIPNTCEDKSNISALNRHVYCQFSNPGCVTKEQKGRSERKAGRDLKK